MVEIHKKIVLDEDQRPFAVQVPIKEFERLEEIIENYGLSKLMDEVEDGYSCLSFKHRCLVCLPLRRWHSLWSGLGRRFK